MREGEFKHVTMMTPAPGFTARVMDRIAEHERATARRRRMLLVGALALAVSLFTVAIVGLVVLTVVTLTVNSDTLLSVLLVALSLVDTASGFAESLWVSGENLSRVITPAQIVMYAAAVLGMTLLWVRVIASLPQRPLTTTR